MDAGLTMNEYKRYDEVDVGDVYPPEPLVFDVSEEVVDGFLQATGNDSAFYKASQGKRRAPSMIASVYLVDLLMARRSPPGGIHAKQAIRFHAPIEIGEKLRIQGRVVEKYIRKDRPYIVSDFEVRTGGNALAATGRITSIWGKDP
jgi:3-hydroxybutyryl-CoA dehydratase